MTSLHPDLLYLDGALRPGLAVTLDGDRVVGVGPPPPDAIRLRGRALLPGFVNAHSHAFQRGLRGHVQHAEGPDSFWSWRERMYTLATTLTPEAVEAVSALAFLEMLKAGFTTVGEFHYLHHQPDGTPYADPDELALRVVAAAERVGLRIVLLRVAYARAGFGVAPNPRQRRFLDPSPDHALAAVARLRARGVTAGLAPHSVRACPAEWLRAFASFDGPIHAHVDEQPAEIEQCLAEHGRRPLHVFADAGLVSPRFTAVHLTWPDDAEIAALAGASVCACPTTELDLGDGFLPLARLGDTSLCIGSDSHAAIDPFYELRSIEWHARATSGRRNVFPHQGPDGLAARLVEVGTVGGARALGVEAGHIAPGRLADLVAVDLDRIELEGARTLPGLVFSGHPSWVTDVWVGGRRVVEDGRSPVEAAVRAEARGRLSG